MRTMHRGDITLITVILISAIMLTILGSLSQKSNIESVISRENLYSQQAIQAANTGLDDWIVQFIAGTVDINNIAQRDWPNTPPGGWQILTGSGSNVVEYQVKYIPATGTNRDKIESTGRVRRGNLIIERTLEQEFE